MDSLQKFCHEMLRVSRVCNILHIHIHPAAVLFTVKSSPVVHCTTCINGLSRSCILWILLFQHSALLVVLLRSAARPADCCLYLTIANITGTRLLVWSKFRFFFFLCVYCIYYMCVLYIVYITIYRWLCSIQQSVPEDKNYESICLHMCKACE